MGLVMKESTVYRVVTINSDHAHYFYRRGIIPDSQIRIITQLAFNGPVIIEVEGQRIALRKEEFKCLVLS